MALDQIEVMRHFGFVEFDVLAHDRGARVAHRLALDHPKAVKRLVLLDIAPTLAMYEKHPTNLRVLIGTGSFSFNRRLCLNA
jgi:haloacetate dehalogenase